MNCNVMSTYSNKSKYVLVFSAAIVFASTIILNDRYRVTTLLRAPTPVLSFYQNMKQIRLENTSLVNTGVGGDRWTFNTDSHNLWQPDDFQVTVDNNIERKVIVIIVTNKRSGSSFFGELFNRNPDAFYAFEPLMYFTMMAIHGVIQNDQFDSLSLQTLKCVSKCDFQNVPYLEDWWKNAKVRLLACPESVDCKTLLKSMTIKQGIEMMTERCRTSHVIAIKTIRLANIESLREFVENENLNIKILHLVRDPRAVMNSRWNLKQLNYEFERKVWVKDEILDLCEHSERNIEYISTRPTWLRGRYKLVRFEDVASSPNESAQQIYKFLGIEYPLSLANWIKNNTIENKGGPYGTSKKSTEIINKWMKEIDFPTVNEIQQKCKSTMNALGYRIIENKELLNINEYKSYESRPQALEYL